MPTSYPVRHRRLAHACLLALLVLSSAPTAAASLAEVVQQALERRPQAAVSGAQGAVGADYERQAKRLLGGEPLAALRYQSDQIGSDQGLRETEAYVELPLWLPGQRQARRELGERIRDQAAADYELLRWEVAEQVRERAWDLRLAQAERALAERQLASARAFEDEIRRRTEAGELAQIDLLLARKETLDREASYRQTLATEETRRAAWRSYTGFDQLPDDLEQESLAEGEPDDRHPLLAAAARARDHQRALRDNARVSRRENPLLSLGARRERGTDTDRHINSVGAEIKIPFGGGSYTAPAVAEAEAALTESQAAYAETHQDLELRLEQQRLALAESETALALAEQRNRLAQQGLGLAERAFQLGESGLRSLLLSREDAAEAALQLERRRLERLRAIARYNQSLGVIPR